MHKGKLFVLVQGPPHLDFLAVLLWGKRFIDSSAEFLAPHLAVLESQPAYGLQPNVLIRTILHDPLAKHCNLRIIFLHILLPFRDISITVSRQKQYIHKPVEQFVIVWIFGDSVSRNRNAVINSALTDSVLKSACILSNFALFRCLIHSHQTVNADSEEISDCRQQFNVRVAGVVLPPGHGLIRNTENWRKFFLGYIPFTPQAFDLITDI